ncbi:DNA topoisomerase-1 [Sphingomonas kaistensis]|uniref:DNA topoisomerase n=1 Tax=Sphingomonas kaistensis TaxID=298708 RepID=A0A7X5Y755_9SPHN|nr:DNA topoisomerase IB [Sphingomonas kaistensis]NJC06417.1 DNA topoisomerase-1 [Sphingomonas kaistensis]
MEPSTPARLRHCCDDQPGITRSQIKGKWAYYSPDGKRITDRDEIDRLNKIALPPAYTDAWFCPFANGHIQATGRDAKGRKQYRYHEAFRGRQDKKKYLGTVEFGAALPKLRRRVEKDLGGKPTSREAVLAAVVRLLDTEHIRIGNESYAKENKSFGATTLRSRHLRKLGNKLLVKFKGKHGITRELAITDAKLKRVVSKITELPGQNLFQYVDEEGETCAIASSDVNDYIREATGGDFTAKNFRTWSASVIAFDQMLSAQEEEVRKISLKTVLEPVAEALGNTPAISRKSYVHPRLIEATRENPKRPLGSIERPRARKYLSSEEVGLINWLMKGKKKPAGAKQAQANVDAAVKAADVSMAKVDAVAKKVAAAA